MVIDAVEGETYHLLVLSFDQIDTSAFINLCGTALLSDEDIEYFVLANDVKSKISVYPNSVSNYLFFEREEHELNL